jgi:hypothetical protein
MQNHPKALNIFLTVLFLAGCVPAPAGGLPAGATGEPSLPGATPTEAPEGWGTVSVVNSTMYRDNWGDYMVVGMIYNGTEQAVTDIKLTLRAADSAGNSVLQDYSGGNWVTVDSAEVSLYESDTVPDVIPPGGYAPFATVINTGVPATYSIELTSTDPTSADFVNVLVENSQVFDDGDGNYFIAGELVNTGTFPVHVEAITGAVLDNAGKVQAVGDAWAYGGYLLAAGDRSGLDRAPFSIQIHGPMTSYTGFGVYPLVVADEPGDETAYSAVVTHTFVSDLDQFHVVGQVTSHTTGQVAAPEMLAALYDENGLVIDVNKLYCFPTLNPGEIGFVDVYRFSAIDAMPELAGRVASAKLQINPESILDVTAATRLKTQSVTREHLEFGPSWHFTGYVVNTTGAPIDDATVAVAVYSADGTLVGADFAYLTKSGDIPAGGTEKFDLYVTLDPSLDPSTLTYEIIAWDD